MPRPTLVIPASEHLASYRAALSRGWSPDNVRGIDAAHEQLKAIAADPDAFIASLDDPDARGARIALPDGSTVERLPSILRWIWDGEVAGSIGLRWQRGTSLLPAHVLGHIGFAVVPWRRGRGFATAALGQMLNEARRRNLAFVDLTTSPENAASQRVIEANGGTLIGRFAKDSRYGGGDALRWRIALDA